MTNKEEKFIERILVGGVLLIININNYNIMVKNKGLGDSIEEALQKIGVDKIAKKVLGEDCGCEERKKTLNSIFPYTKLGNLHLTRKNIRGYNG